MRRTGPNGSGRRNWVQQVTVGTFGAGQLSGTNGLNPVMGPGSFVTVCTGYVAENLGRVGLVRP